MEDLGLPENPEATPVEPGTDAVAPPESAPPPETIELKWGREAREVSRERFSGLAEELGVGEEALRTWVQMGRDASNVYSESRRRAEEVARREARLETEKQALEQRLNELNGRSAGAPAPTRRSVADDPVKFWDEFAQKVDKIDKIDRIERMLEETNKRIVAEKEAEAERQTERQFIEEYQRMASEWEAKSLPKVELQDIASALDRFVTQVPEDVSIRELLDMGYRIVTWDKVGKARAQAEIKRRTNPRAAIEIPAPSPGRVEPAEGGASPGETLEQRRARLHRQVGGLTFNDMNSMRDRG